MYPVSGVFFPVGNSLTAAAGRQYFPFILAWNYVVFLTPRLIKLTRACYISLSDPGLFKGANPSAVTQGNQTELIFIHLKTVNYNWVAMGFLTFRHCSFIALLHLCDLYLTFVCIIMCYIFLRACVNRFL